MHTFLKLLAVWFFPVFLTATAAASEWLPMKVDNGKILVASSFANIDGYSVIDTGSNWSAINTRFIEKYNLALNPSGKTQSSGFFQNRETNFYQDVPATLLNTELRFDYLGEVTMRSENTQLLVGGDFLQHFIVQFDYPNQRMRWLTRDALDLDKISNVPSRVDKHTNSVIAKVRLNNEQDLWVTVDTGATSGLWINRSLAARRGWLKKHNAKTALARGANAAGEIEQFRLPKVQIGDFETTNTLVSVPASGQQQELFSRTTRPGSKMLRSKGKARGLLGWDALKDFVVTIDYRIGKLHLEHVAPA